MKKLILLTLLLLSFVGIKAQTEDQENVITNRTSVMNKHIKFMGIEMTGTLKDFANKLVSQKGMTILYEDKVGIALEGYFTGVRCQIQLMPKKDGEIGGAMVVYPEETSWTPIESRYTQLKNSLTQKYGEPYNCTETFSDENYVNTNFAKFRAAKDGECQYMTRYKNIQGTYGKLSLTIIPNNNMTVSVALLYYDGTTVQEQMSADDDL